MPTIDKDGVLSLAIPPEAYAELAARAEQSDISLTRAVIKLLSAGLGAERQKRERLDELLGKYRECTDPQVAARLGDEVGAMIFGQ